MPGRQGIIDRQGGINFQGIFPGISWGRFPNIPGIYHGNVPQIFHEHIFARWGSTTENKYKSRQRY